MSKLLWRIFWILFFIFIIYLVYRGVLHLRAWYYALDKNTSTPLSLQFEKETNTSPEHLVGFNFALNLLTRATYNLEIPLDNMNIIYQDRLLYIVNYIDIQYILFKEPTNIDSYITSLALSQHILVPFQSVYIFFPFISIPFLPLVLYNQYKHDIIKPHIDGDEYQDILIERETLQLYQKYYYKYFQHTFQYDSKIKHVVFAGHSQGAGLVQICIMDLIMNIFSKLGTKPQLYLYLFASPRIGNHAFAQWIDTHTTQCINIQNTCDVVTTLPNSVTPNVRQPKSPHFYEHPGIPVSFTLNRGTLTSNHVIETYYYSIIQQGALEKIKQKLAQ